jgi:CubicO group peptidase (beta-lactamase class C family)
VGRATAHQLLSHTSGLAAEAPGPWWERTPGELRPRLEDVVPEGPAPHPAGRRFHYSNPGYALLGALVEHVRGEDWAGVLRREVLEPLGMRRTSLKPRPPHAEGWAVHPWADVLLAEAVQETGRMAAAGQLWSTAEDLSRWAAFLAAGHPDVLSADTVARMREPAAPSDPGTPASGYGLGLQTTCVDGRQLVGHSGSMPGFVATLWLSTADGLAGIALANATSGLAAAALAADLVAVVAEREPRIPEEWRPLEDVDTRLLDLTGPWYWGASPFVLRLKADRSLELQPMDGKGRGSRFRAEPDGTWTGLDGYYAGEVLRVVQSPDGRVGHLDLGTFFFTRKPYAPAAPVPGGVDPRGWRGASH